MYRFKIVAAILFFHQGNPGTVFIQNVCHSSIASVGSGKALVKKIMKQDEPVPLTGSPILLLFTENLFRLRNINKDFLYNKIFVEVFLCFAPVNFSISVAQPQSIFVCIMFCKFNDYVCGRWNMCNRFIM